MQHFQKHTAGDRKPFVFRIFEAANFKTYTAYRNFTYCNLSTLHWICTDYDLLLAFDWEMFVILSRDFILVERIADTRQTLDENLFLKKKKIKEKKN